MTVNSDQYSVNSERLAAATAVRDACVQAALTAYENARMDGLCHEGAWECAVDAMRSLPVETVITQISEKRLEMRD